MRQKGEERHPAAVIIFSIITCGIYLLVWIYKFSKEMKNYLGKDDINPGLEVFLCLICIIYLIYWSYKYGKLLQEAQQAAGLPADDNSVLFLVLSLLGFFIVDVAIMQDAVNKIWKTA